MVTKNKKFKLFIVAMLICLNVTPLFAGTSASNPQSGLFSPDPTGVFYSDAEWGVFVQLMYGSLSNERVFLDDLDTLPRPEMFICMGGLERDGERNITISSFEYNTTSEEFDIPYKKNEYRLKMGDGGNEHYAIRQVNFPVSSNTSLLVYFNYADIFVRFHYKPNSIYTDFITTQYWLTILVIAYIIASCVVFYGANRLGHKVQKKVNVVPPYPIQTTILATLVAGLGFMLMLALEDQLLFIERILSFLLSFQPWLLLLPIGIIFTLHQAAQYSKKTKILQLDYSMFEENNVDADGKTINPWSEVGWTKDQRNDLRVYEKNGKHYLCDPWSWKELVYRLLGFDIELIGHRGSIQPDRGIWTPNDERVYVAMTNWVVNDKVLRLDLNLSAQMLGQRGVLIIIGIATLFPVGLGIITGIGAAILTLIGIGVIIMSVFWSGGLVNMHFPKRYWEFSTIRFREAEVILRQQEDLLDINKRTIELETELAVTKAAIPDLVVREVRPIVDAIEDTLLYRKQLNAEEREEKKDDGIPESV